GAGRRSIFGVGHRQHRQLHLEHLGALSGTSSALESLEPVFQQHLNGDGSIGPPTTGNPPGTVIEAFGSTSLVEVGSNYFLYPVGGSSGPELSYYGAPVAAGQFGTWTPIGAERTASGYDVAWKVTGADQYSVWATDPPPLKWSDLRYVFDIKEDCNGKE